MKFPNLIKFVLQLKACAGSRSTCLPLRP